MSELEQQKSIDEIEVDLANLYREEAVTDLRVASIRCLIPIQPDGSDDPSRERIYTGETQVMTQAGPLPVNFRIEAGSLEDACNEFPTAMRAAVERLMEEAREIQRREASRIVTPSDFDPITGGPGGVPGAAPGGLIRRR